MLGRDLVATSPTSDLVSLTRTDLDIVDAARLSEIVAKVRPAVIINAAAYTAVDRAEVERDTAFRVNAVAVGAIGKTAKSAGSRVVHLSTDYVFDGSSSNAYTEESKTNPINVYGQSKLAGEKQLKESGAEYLIVRTQWLFGDTGKSFPDTMAQRAKAGTATRVVNDQWGRPTYTRDLAMAVWELIEGGHRGVFHIANAGDATWFDVAERVFAHFDRSDLLASCRSADYLTLARRPMHSVLSTKRAEDVLGRSLPHWTESLDQFLCSKR
jgi:dTDP-4-dehydrorhamnose reductase